MNIQRVPKVGEKFFFYDSGKATKFRQYEATVTKVIPYEEANKIIEHFNYAEYEVFEDFDLQKIHTITFEEDSYGDGTPDLYAKETDYFIGCEIPDFDSEIIWFVRTTDGGWYSMDIQNGWQGGRLDVEDLIKLD